MDQRLHLEQLDEALAPLENAVAFEQRLALERVELEVLGKGVDEVLVADRLRQPRLRPGPLHGDGEQRLQAVAMAPQLGPIAFRRQLRQRRDTGDTVRPRVILAPDAKPLQTPQNDVETAFVERPRSASFTIAL
jgi:hypothetical protein